MFRSHGHGAPCPYPDNQKEPHSIQQSRHQREGHLFWIPRASRTRTSGTRPRPGSRPGMTTTKPSRRDRRGTARRALTQIRQSIGFLKPLTSALSDTRGNSLSPTCENRFVLFERKTNRRMRPCLRRRFVSLKRCFDCAYVK